MKKVLIISLLILVNTLCFSQSFNNQRLDSLFNVLEKNDKFMGSIAVSQNGQQLYSRAIGYADVENSKKADTNTRYRIGSISKIFTASLIFKAVDEKKISLSQTLDQYFPQIENAKLITIGNLLNHRSGIHNFTDDEHYRSITFYTEPKSEKQMMEILAKQKSDFVPDSKSAYSNSNYVILSYILERVYNKSYATLLEAKIIKPLGLKNTHFGGKTQIQNNESYSYHFVNKWDRGMETDLSIPMGAGGIVSTPGDLTVFIEQLFEGELISLKSLAQMKTINGQFGFGILEFANANRNSYGHNGAIDDFQSIVSYFPTENLSVAITSNGSVYTKDQVLAAALSAYFSEPFTMPVFVNIELKPEVLDLYLGMYQSQEVPIKIAITKRENRLFAEATGQPAFLLEASTSNTFKFDPAGIVLEFDASKKEMILKQGGKEYIFSKE